MNIIDYVSYYGDYLFEERPFNEVDNLVLSVLSYVDYGDLIPKKGITIEKVSELFFNSYDEKKKRILAIKDGINLLKNVSDKKRYKDIVMMNYCYIGNENSQFSVVSFKINSKLYYVSFEGTDELLSGWEEDCKMAYSFPVDAHVYSKNYLNKNFTFKRCEIIVGGHSKGGNLALVASMYANKLVRKKIKTVYSNDGQGLRKAQIESKQYSLIKDRYIHIIPNYSIVGLLLRHTDDYVVIKSNKKGFMAHDALTWQVSYDHFEKDHLSRSSKVFDEGFSKWLDKYDDEKRKLFVKEIFKVIKDNGIKDLMEINLKKELILNIVKQSKEINPLVKEMTIELFKVIGKTNFEYPLF